jgi:hypothetical protein
MKTTNALNHIAKILQTRIVTLVNKLTASHSNIYTSNSYTNEMNAQPTNSISSKHTVYKNESVYAWKAPKWLVD